MKGYDARLKMLEELEERTSSHERLPISGRRLLPRKATSRNVLPRRSIFLNSSSLTQYR